MAETTVAFPDPDDESEPARGGRRDRHPDSDGWLGDFRRGPAVFALFRTGPNNGGHPHLQPEYRIECNDGAGPRMICRFTDEPEAVYEWFGAWRNDEWCDWILQQARRLIANPENT
jgi:hypothetical protein